MRRKTPQEKKELSYDKDRRNVYGEAPHAARRNIPLRKKLRNRANRHAQERPLPSTVVPADEEVLDEIASEIYARAPVVWEKSPDAPLRAIIKSKRRRRETGSRYPMPPRSD